MSVQPINIPTPFKYYIPFGIYKGTIKKPYGEYTWGEYKGNKIEIFDASRDNQKLIYVSKGVKFIKSKLTYFFKGKKRVARAEGGRDVSL